MASVLRGLEFFGNVPWLITTAGIISALIFDGAVMRSARAMGHAVVGSFDRFVDVPFGLNVELFVVLFKENKG